MVSALFGDRARLSQVLGSLPEWEGRIGTTTNDLRDATATGELTGVLVEPPVSSPPGPADDCGYRVAGRPVTIRLEEPPAPAVVRLEYLAARTSPARVDAGGESFEVQLADGLGVVYLFPAGPVDHVRISGVDEDLPVCVVRVAAAPPLLSPDRPSVTVAADTRRAVHRLWPARPSRCPSIHDDTEVTRQSPGGPHPGRAHASRHRSDPHRPGVLLSSSRRPC